jgi:hypothetical protein
MKLLVSPLVRGAYFADYRRVAEAELLAHYPDTAIRFEAIGSLEFLEVDLPVAQAPALARLSFVQGLFEGDGDRLVPLSIAPAYRLDDDWVYGSKYAGKTNELATRLAINVALRLCASRGAGQAPLTLLDPMAGQGTTLLWAMRYGLNARGIELDPRVLDGLRNHIGKQTRRHRIRHTLDTGSTGPARSRSRDGTGRFLRVTVDDCALQLIIGDSAHAPDLLARQRFDLLVTDLPYGIQHRGPGGQDPLEAVQSCAAAWVASKRSGGAIGLMFNNYRPGRAQLEHLFTDLGCTPAPFCAPHRMSESIVRDLLVLIAP